MNEQSGLAKRAGLHRATPRLSATDVCFGVIFDGSTMSARCPLALAFHRRRRGSHNGARRAARSIRRMGTHYFSRGSDSPDTADGICRPDSAPRAWFLRLFCTLTGTGQISDGSESQFQHRSLPTRRASSSDEFCRTQDTTANQIPGRAKLIFQPSTRWEQHFQGLGNRSEYWALAFLRRTSSAGFANFCLVVRDEFQCGSTYAVQVMQPGKKLGGVDLGRALHMPPSMEHTALTFRILK
jgi:hypothetical protein